jgi:hypothetical protein
MTVGRRASAVRVALLGVTAVVALGCSPAEPAASTAPAASVVKEPDAGASAVPAAPQDRPLLTITGRIAATNGAGTLSLDQAQLDRLGLLAMSVNDPWAKQRIGVQGVWLRDLVNFARPDGAATSLARTCSTTPTSAGWCGTGATSPSARRWRASSTTAPITTR